MMNSFNLTLSEKHFIYSSILNDSFAGYSNLGCRSLPFMTWNTSFQCLLACEVSFEKSADSLMGLCFYNVGLSVWWSDIQCVLLLTIGFIEPVNHYSE